MCTSRWSVMALRCTYSSTRERAVVLHVLTLRLWTFACFCHLCSLKAIKFSSLSMYSKTESLFPPLPLGIRDDSLLYGVLFATSFLFTINDSARILLLALQSTSSKGGPGLDKGIHGRAERRCEKPSGIAAARNQS